MSGRAWSDGSGDWSNIEVNEGGSGLIDQLTGRLLPGFELIEGEDVVEPGGGGECHVVDLRVGV